MSGLIKDCRMPTVEFLIEKKKVNVGMYANLKTVAKKNGINVGNGLVEVIEGTENLSPRSFLEKTFLKDKPDNVRVAGQTEVLGDVCIITDYKPKPSRQ